MSKGLEMLENKELKIKSVELVDIINQFRSLENDKAELRHESFMSKIKKELEVLKTMESASKIFCWLNIWTNKRNLDLVMN